MPNWLKKAGKALEKAGRDISREVDNATKQLDRAVDKAARQVDSLVSEAAGMPEGVKLGHLFNPDSGKHKAAMNHLKGNGGESPEEAVAAPAPAPASAAAPAPASAPDDDTELAAAIKLSLEEAHRAQEPEDLSAYLPSAAAPASVDHTSDPTASVSALATPAPVDASATSSSHVPVAGDYVDPMQYM